MPPSPALRCSPGRELRSENHKRGRSLEGGILFREKDDDLALFNEMQSKERDNFLLQSNDDFEDLFSTKLRYFSDYKLGISIPARGESSDLLNAEGEKNDYDWLLTPPDTPLFPSLDDEAPPVNHAQRGRPRSQPIAISRSSTMERSHRSSRGSASPNRLSPSPQSSHSTYQSRGRPSSAPHSSPPPSLRHATPTRRPSPSPSKPSMPASRSSTPTPRRMSTGSSSHVVPSKVRGNSPVKTGRGNSASPKIKAWQANIPGFSSEAPPNLRTSLADRPASYVRGSSPASRSGSKSGRQSMSPTASRSISSSYSHDQDRFSAHSKGSVASSGDDDLDSLQSIPVSSSDHSAPRSISTFSNHRGLSSSKKPTRIVTSSSAPKRSFDMAIRQMDQRKGPQNMFRPLLSSVPSSTFYAGKSGSAHRFTVSRNSSVTTSSIASSDRGISGVHDTEGSEQNQEDVTTEHVKTANADMQEKVCSFDKVDSSDEKSGISVHEQLPDNPHDEIDGRDSQLVGDEASSLHDTAMEISATSELLEVKGDFSDMDCLEENVLCSKCGRSFSAAELIEGDLKLCKECKGTDISSVVTNSPKRMVVDENSPGVSPKIFYDGSLDAFSPPIETPEYLEVTSMGEPGTSYRRKIASEGQNSYSEPNRILLPASNVAQHLVEEGEQILIGRQVGDQQTVSCSTANGKSGFQQLQDLSGSSCSKADVSEGAGISLILKSSSGKGPIVRSRTFTATSITCDDFSYMRDNATSTRSSFGHGSYSASSSVDLGSTRQIETRVQWQISGGKSDTENYRYEMKTKHQRSGSSLSGTSTHAFHTLSLARSCHDESFEVSAMNAEKGMVDATCVAMQGLSLTSENREGDNVGTDIESDNNWGTVSELSGCTMNIHLGDTLVAAISNFEESDLHGNGRVLTNNSPSANAEASCMHIETCIDSEDAMLIPCIDGVDVADAPNYSSLDVISEMEIENDEVVSPDSVFDIGSQNSKSSIDDLQEPAATACYSNIAAPIEESTNQDHRQNILEESTVMLEGQGGNHARSLTLEEATDTILFCSSIVHNLAYEAANIAIEKENSAPLEGFHPVVTIVGKSNTDRRDSRARPVAKRNSKSQKARQRRLETDSKPPPENTENDEKSDSSTTRIVGAPDKGDSMKPPKLESRCNCTIM